MFALRQTRREFLRVLASLSVATRLRSAAAAAETQHPLMITAMRQRTYLASALTIERALQPGLRHSRMIAAYTSDGLKQFAALSVPNGARPASGWPAIVMNHGYIEPARYRTETHYAAQQALFAQAGYLVFQPDYRGHGASEGIASDAYGAPDYTVDVLNGLAALRASGQIDLDKVFMWGHSMGGHISLRAMVVDQNIRAGAIWAGVVATYAALFQQWGRAKLPAVAMRWRDALVAEHGSPAANPAFWDAISPVSFVGDAGPLQLHHGNKDTVVPEDFTTSLAVRLALANQPYAYYTYKNDDHNLSRSTVLATQRTLAWFAAA